MSINFKQEELIDELVNTLIKKFPEVEFINISESPEDSESLWINVTSPKDEDKEIELREFASDKTTSLEAFSYRTMGLKSIYSCEREQITKGIWQTTKRQLSSAILFLG